MDNLTAARRFEPLSTTAHDLKELLDGGRISTRQIIERYLSQIKTHNHDGMKIRAIISTPPESQILDAADKLDEERQNGKLRGPYHGIPIIVKDTINTNPSLGMKTTLGSHILENARPTGNAKIIDLLLERGIIVLGKANLSEFAAAKCSGGTAGFSLVGGQTQSAYIEGGVIPGDLPFGPTNPAGSSSGSATGVAAGFAPWAIGAETNGSLNAPASRSSLYALKPTEGNVSNDGIYRLTESFDSLGGMAKSVADLAAVTEMLISTVPSTSTPFDFQSFLRTDWKVLAVGFIDLDSSWKLPESMMHTDEEYINQKTTEYQAAATRIAELGGKVITNISLNPLSHFRYEGKSGYNIVRNAQFRGVFNEYLKNLESSPVRSLKELIQHIEAHHDTEFSKEMPNQKKFLSAQADTTPQETISEALKAMRKLAGPDEIDRLLRENGVDVLVAPMDSQITTLGALSGYPIGTMPLGYLRASGRPYGLCLIAAKNHEHIMLSVMSAWEATIFHRQLPAAMLKFVTASEKL